MRPQRNRWYVIGWTDAPCQPALCLGVQDGEPEFFFPLAPRGRPQIDTVDGNEQVLAELAIGEVPPLPPLYQGHVCAESKSGRIIKPK